MSRKTTLSQIAEAAGVSLSTVDRVLNRRGGVSPSAEERVLDWASRLNIDRVVFREYLKVLRIAVVMQTPKNPFYKGLQDAFADLNKAMLDLRVSCFIHYIDVTDAIRSIHKVNQISTTHDALIIISPDDPRLSDALKLVSQRIPIVTLVTDLPNSGRIAYIGPDNRQTGRVAGELMGRFLGPEGGEVIVVLGLHRIVGHEEREMGFRSALRERFPACRIFASLESGEDRERAGEVVFEALKDNPSVRGVYNISDGNTAIARSIRSLGLEGKVVLITHELTPDRRVLLRDGMLDAVIDQNPRLEAQRALEVLGQHFKRTHSERAVEGYTEFNIFIRENCPPLGEGYR
ncbi:MAG TPA: LacI family DNA-binding transcriptional regulator [Roseiarcus sp.]|nr:LacI family DNA-binding transcriptional regulator [Roseiarcus sp.]